jgi:hypothetical protein
VLSWLPIQDVGVCSCVSKKMNVLTTKVPASTTHNHASHRTHSRTHANRSRACGACWRDVGGDTAAWTTSFQITLLQVRCA